MRAALVVVLTCAVVHAQPRTAPAAGALRGDYVAAALAQIATLEAALEYEQALVLADRTIARGEATRAQLVELHLAAGRLAAGLDHPEVAQAHFAKVLALAPATALPAGTSPKLEAPFAAARAARPELEVALEASAAGVRVRVISDPLQLVQGIRVVVARGATRATHRAPALELALAADEQVVTIEALDEAGNQLALREGGAVATAGATGPAGTSGVAAPPEVSLWKHWLTYTAASGAALIGGGLCAWRYGVAQDAWNRENDGLHDYSRLHALETRGQRWAIAADVGFGVAAIAGVTAAVLFATREHEASPRVVWTGTGAALVAHF